MANSPLFSVLEPKSKLFPPLSQVTLAGGGLRLTHGRFSWASPEMESFTATRHWPELGHVVTPNHKGGWEMKCSCEPRWPRKQVAVRAFPWRCHAAFLPAFLPDTHLWKLCSYFLGNGPKLSSVGHRASGAPGMRSCLPQPHWQLLEHRHLPLLSTARPPEHLKPPVMRQVVQPPPSDAPSGSLKMETQGPCLRLTGSCTFGGRTLKYLIWAKVREPPD